MNSTSEGAQLGFGLIDLDLRGLGVAGFRGAALRLSGLCRLSPGYSGPKDYIGVVPKEGPSRRSFMVRGSSPKQEESCNQGFPASPLEKVVCGLQKSLNSASRM